MAKTAHLHAYEIYGTRGEYSIDVRYRGKILKNFMGIDPADLLAKSKLWAKNQGFDKTNLTNEIGARLQNPAPRKYRGKYPRRIASTSSAVKDGVYVFVLNDGTSHRVATRDLIAAGYQKQAPQPGEDFDYVLTALEATRKTNPAKRPAPKKRAISRPSQVTKKAPSKRLVARRKVAAKKPVKGYFPNPVAFTTPGPSRKAHWDLPHLFPQPGGAYMVSFWNDKTKKWVPATLAYSMNEAKKWLDFQGYKKAVLLK